MISVQQSKMIFERTIVQAFTVFEQIVARSCAEKRNMVAKRWTAKRIEPNGGTKTAEFTKARQDDRSILVQFPILSEIDCFW